MKIYGEPKPTKELTDSIAKHGLLQPIIVNAYPDGSYEILAGNTRAAVWRMLWEQGRIKSSWVPCRILHLSPLEAERLIIESNRQRVKTKGQQARETRELVRIEAALAKERMTLGVKNASRGGNLIRRSEVRPGNDGYAWLAHNINGELHGNLGKATEIVAKQTKQSNRTVEKQVAIVKAAEAGDPLAQIALDQLDHNKISLGAAYRTIISPQVLNFKRSKLGGMVANLETLARKLPNALRDPNNKEFHEEAERRIGAAGKILARI